VRADSRSLNSRLGPSSGRCSSGCWPRCSALAALVRSAIVAMPCVAIASARSSACRPGLAASALSRGHAIRAPERMRRGRLPLPPASMAGRRGRSSRRSSVPVPPGLQGRWRSRSRLCSPIGSSGRRRLCRWRLILPAEGEVELITGGSSPPRSLGPPADRFWSRLRGSARLRARPAPRAPSGPNRGGSSSRSAAPYRSGSCLSMTSTPRGRRWPQRPRPCSAAVADRLAVPLSRGHWPTLLHASSLRIGSLESCQSSIEPSE
jgi:hypothetical protein